MENFSWGATVLFAGTLAVVISFTALLKRKKQSVSIILRRQDDAHPRLFKVALACATLLSFAIINLLRWEIAALLMLIIAEHEYGHIWAMYKSGILAQGFFFIPFFGGGTVEKKEMERFPRREDEAFIALMGPAWGLLLAFLFYLPAVFTGWPFLYVCAGMTALVNLANLLPINPLDGGRVIKCAAFSAGKRLGLGFLALNLLLSGGLSFYVCQKFYYDTNAPSLLASLFAPADPDAPLSITLRLFLLFMVLFIALSANLVFVGAGSNALGEYRDRAQTLPRMTGKQIAAALAAYCLTSGALLLIVFNTNILNNLISLFAG